ncbi:hypothetical protein FACS189451_00620 [Bacteroidia bacterium]|nr:hypothetical protein FACS189451_00620 [Bacteroidia bacterium]
MIAEKWITNEEKPNHPGLCLLKLKDGDLKIGWCYNGRVWIGQHENKMINDVEYWAYINII